MGKVYQGFMKTVELIFRIIVYVTSLFIPVLLFCNVIGRYFIHNPIVGAEELAVLAFATMIIFGSGIVYYRRQFIKVDFFISKIEGAPRHVINIIGEVCTLSIYIILIVCFVQAIPVQSNFKTGIFHVNKALYDYALIASFAFMSISCVEFIVKEIKAMAAHQ